MKKLTDFVLSKTVKRILEDPVFKSYYCLKIVDCRGDVVLSPVIDHGFLTRVVVPGLNIGIASKTIKSYEYIASQVSEDEATDALYQELDYINEDKE